MTLARPKMIHGCSAGQNWPNSGWGHSRQQIPNSAPLNRTQQKDTSHD